MGDASQASTMRCAYLSCANAPRNASAAALVATLVFLGPGARADSPAAVRELALFTIAKSENKNQVQYAIRVDEHCAPESGAPVFAYWRMLEKGSDRTEPLLARELDGYGIASQAVVARDAGGGRGSLVLRAVPGRTIPIETWHNGTGCQAR